MTKELNLEKEVEILQFELGRLLTKFREDTGHAPKDMMVVIGDMGGVHIEINDTIEVDCSCFGEFH